MACPADARDDLILPLVPRLVGTRGSEALERRRVALAADWLVRTHLPAWFRLAKLNVEGDALAGLPALADIADLAAWCDHLERARKRAAVAKPHPTADRCRRAGRGMGRDASGRVGYRPGSTGDRWPPDSRRRLGRGLRCRLRGGPGVREGLAGADPSRP
ncbi:hypothetical protein ACU4GR_27230 [Methylobacterium oryzae CBMB20]